MADFNFRLRHRHPRTAIAVLAATIAAVAVAPTTASAQSCYDLRRQYDALGDQAERLGASYPGTALVLTACAATASNTYDRYIAQGRTEDFATGEAMGTFTACAAISCLFVGYGNCIDVASRLFDLMLRADRIEQQMRRQRCPQ